MKFRYLISLLTTSLVLLLFSCSDQSGIPKTLQNILDRQGVTTAAGAGVVSGSGTGNGSNYSSYSGAYASDVKLLLSKVSNWKTFSCLTCNDGVPPRVDVDKYCQRDAYVAAAVNFAWAAENYYRLGKTAEAITQATNMNSQLQMAKRLCSNGISFCSGCKCLTEWIYSC